MPYEFLENHINRKNLSQSVVLLWDHHVKTTLLCLNQTKINMFHGDTKHLIKMLKTRPNNQNTLKSCWVNWPFSADPQKVLALQFGLAMWHLTDLGSSPRCDDKSHLLVLSRRHLGTI